jgi:glycosyltransferase involved in cell wall biosynthesis
MKIRILFTIPNFKTAGSGREMFNIIERLDKNRFDVVVCVNEHGGNLFDEIESKGYKIIVHKHTVSSPKNVIEIFKLGLFFRSLKFDIWQSFHWSSDFTESVIAKIAGSKYLYVKKSMNFDRRGWKIKSSLSWRIIARNTDMVNGFLLPYSKKIRFITGGVEYQKFLNPSPKNKYSLIDKEKVTLVCIAQLVRVKGQDTLIKACSKLDNIEILLCGADRDVKYKNELIELVDTLKMKERVKFMGSIGNVAEFLHSADIFVLPTSKKGGHEEGCPVALLEAMASGIICVASNVGGSNDLILQNKTGFLFPADDENELEQVLKQVISSDNLIDFTKNAVNLVVSKHSLETEGLEFQNVYLETV